MQCVYPKLRQRNDIHFLSIAVELEDIQLQNLVPEQVESGPPQHQAPSNNQSQPQTPQINKYLNNNAAKEDLASSASLGNISLAFSRIPGHGEFENNKIEFELTEIFLCFFRTILNRELQRLFIKE